MIEAYQHGVYPRSEDVVAATRGLERGRTSPDEVAVAFKKDHEELVQVQQEAGLDYFSDGLLRWQDLFRPFVEAARGMEARTLVRWFDNNSFFRAPEVTGELRLEADPPAVFDDGANLPEPRVATMPSPFLFSRAAVTEGNREALLKEAARAVLGPVAATLAGRGYRLIHLQEPWLPYFGIDDEAWGPLEEGLSAIRDAVRASSPEARVVLHTYFGDAAPYAQRLRHLPVDAVGIDFAETDLDALGAKWDVGVMAGVLDGRRSVIEPVDATVAFGRRLAETLQPPFMLVSSNCELEFLPQALARQKVLRLGEIAAGLKEVLG